MTSTDPSQGLAWDTPAAAAAYRDRDMRLARQLIFPAVLDRVGTPPGPGATVLDIGCGTGALTVELARAGGWVTTVCHFRPLSAYTALLTGAGFAAPATAAPAVPESERAAGSGLAPYLVLSVVRAPDHG
ncbi:class I SAM-dependent methyltransferase [Streptomyces sp. NPDC054813]